MNTDTQPRQKRKTSDSSCYLCQTEMFPCDEQYPCSRCVEKNRPQMCVYSKPKTPTITKYNIKNDNPTQLGRSPFINQSPVNNNNNFNNMNNNSISNNMNNSISNNMNSNMNSINNNMNNMNMNNMNNSISNNNNSNNNMNIQPQTNFLNEIIKTNNYDNQSIQIAHLLINELKDLKDGQKKIIEEIGSLKNKNEKLEEINETLARQLSLLTTNDSLPRVAINNSSPGTTDINKDSALSYPRNLPEMIDYYQNIFVVFDLLKHPPTVVNASLNFCKLLGYSQSEIIGVPWTQIIHPNRIENTMNIFSTNQKSLVKGSVEMPQVYKHKNGSVFSTIDNHTIIFDGEGRPMCDIVIIKLNTKMLSNHDLISKNNLLLLDDFSPPTTPQSPSKIEDSPSTPIHQNSISNNNVNFNNNNNTNTNNNSFTQGANNYQFGNSNLNINNQFLNNNNNNNSNINNNSNPELYQYFTTNDTPQPIENIVTSSINNPGLNQSGNGMYPEFFNPLGDENMPSWDFNSYDLTNEIQNNSVNQSSPNVLNKPK